MSISVNISVAHDSDNTNVVSDCCVKEYGGVIRFYLKGPDRCVGFNKKDLLAAIKALPDDKENE